MIHVNYIDGKYVEMTNAKNNSKFPPVNAPFVIEVPIKRHQGLLALLSVGITEPQILSGIEAIADVTARETARIRFNQPEWYLTSEFVEWGKLYFNFTEEQVKQLFALAATI